MSVKKFHKNSVCEQSKNHKILYFSLVGVFILITVIATWIILKQPQNPNPKTEPKLAIKFVASAKFNKLNLKEKANYMKQFGNTRNAMRELSSNLNNAEKNALRKNMRELMQARHRERLDAFFKMSKAEQEKQLDEDLARMEARKKAGNGGNKGNRGQRPTPNAQQKRDREASSDPTTRAKAQAYRSMLKQHSQK